MILRLLKYTLIGTLTISTVGISAFTAWKAGYLKLPEAAERGLGALEDVARSSEELAAVKDQLGTLLDAVSPAETAPGNAEQSDPRPLADRKQMASERKIYRWRDGQGNLFITDTPPPKGVKAEEIVVDDGPKVELSESRKAAASPVADSAAETGQTSKSSSSVERRDVTALFGSDTEALRVIEQLQKERTEASQQTD